MRGQPFPQGDVRVGGHSEGLLQLRQLRTAEDGPLPFPLTLHQTDASVRLRRGYGTPTAGIFQLQCKYQEKCQTVEKIMVYNK